ncbi:MAG: hypothetical protein IKW10_06030 [Oscillospiraceae bacterium]|nr:hypothetical protein [Oscillospiraceae bacterium]
MRIAIIVVSCLLWLWFLGCTFTWKFGKVLLVEGMGLKSIEFAALALFTFGIGSFLLWESVGKWVLLPVQFPLISQTWFFRLPVIKLHLL